MAERASFKPFPNRSISMPDKRTSSYDVIIVGGGVVGSAIAYFLAAEQSFDGSIAVIERDPAYADATTPRSVGGI
ncbi:MAG: FAD-dependent oxidoreductase, partial [Gammaproteobacteria bacterium]|nr:FAD-dependent oxidoreductase [Gammaproteobacteria bacterium]